ncbi:MAG TPA: GAF domain-containing protein [Candidatus Obscuribacterales bacterium]
MALANSTQVLYTELDHESLLNRITNRIRQSLELQEILTATVAEVSKLLKTDRVMVYKFDADETGEVIAEFIYANRLPSLLGLKFPADDIPPGARQLYRQVRMQSIVDVSQGLIGLSFLDSENKHEYIEPGKIHYRTVEPCHAEYLTAMGVQSSLVVPIMDGAALWGLLVAHYSIPYPISGWEVEISPEGSRSSINKV